MDNERREELRRLLDRETNEPETQAWRDDLTPDELEYVQRLDDRYIDGIAEIETIRDHCRLRLRDGSLYLARLARDGALRLDALDEVC